MSYLQSLAPMTITFMDGAQPSHFNSGPSGGPLTGHHYLRPSYALNKLRFQVRMFCDRQH
jgi:hypothetical protein